MFWSDVPERIVPSSFARDVTLRRYHDGWIGRIDGRSISCHYDTYGCHGWRLGGLAVRRSSRTGCAYQIMPVHEAIHERRRRAHDRRRLRRNWV